MWEATLCRHQSEMIRLGVQVWVALNSQIGSLQTPGRALRPKSHFRDMVAASAAGRNAAGGGDPQGPDCCSRANLRFAFVADRKMNFTTGVLGVTARWRCRRRPPDGSAPRGADSICGARSEMARSVSVLLVLTALWCSISAPRLHRTLAGMDQSKPNARWPYRSH